MNQIGGSGRQKGMLDGLTARQTLRGLRKSPVVAATVILTLALAIGGNTAIFSIVDQLQHRPLPYPQGDRLVMISGAPRRHDAAGTTRLMGNSNPECLTC